MIMTETEEADLRTVGLSPAELVAGRWREDVVPGVLATHLSDMMPQGVKPMGERAIGAWIERVRRAMSWDATPAVIESEDIIVTKATKGRRGIQVSRERPEMIGRIRDPWTRRLLKAAQDRGITPLFYGSSLVFGTTYPAGLFDGVKRRENGKYQDPRWGQRRRFF